MPSTPGFGEKLRAVFGLSPTILCLTGLADGRVRDANDAFLSASGYTREEILGRTPVELGLWVDPAQRDEGIRQLKAGRTVRGMECRFRVKSGEEIVTVLSADVVMFDGEACILSALTDITDRTRAEDRAPRERAPGSWSPSTPTRCPCPSRACAIIATSRSTMRRCATAATRARRCWARPSRSSASG